MVILQVYQNNQRLLPLSIKYGTIHPCHKNQRRDIHDNDRAHEEPVLFWVFLQPLLVLTVITVIFLTLFVRNVVFTVE